ncbi:hypothetical protein PRZ48_013804 [Zasmidium cellare]|uniref:Uncharacterized protein n=1 Tax=Zasmidium cellare TaxID=395010 RepID=A0ABR0E2L9_ZASCE|nr:hypothetical protein PRZ48_013804 [Zasmidium cellare]
MTLSTTRTKTTFVQPAAPLEAQTITCSAVENICERCYVTTSAFWPVPDSADPLPQYDILTKSLSYVLYQRPILAGTLRQDNRGAFSVEIPPAPGAGCDFHYADLRDDAEIPTYEELERRGFPFADGNEDGLAKLRPARVPEAWDGSPVIVCQMSRLRGCVVLLLLMSHQVADPVAVVVFVLQFAGLTEEMEKAVLAGGPLPDLPERFEPAMEDRALLSPRPSEADCDEKSLELKQYVSIRGMDSLSVLAARRNLFPKSYIPPRLTGRAEQLWRTTVGIWKFSPAKLDQLRDIVRQASPEASKPPSDLDAITAFLWQRFFVAKHSPSENPSTPQTSHILYAGDVRRRLDPPLPQFFLSACVDLFRASQDTTSLTPATSSSSLGASLASAIQAIRQTLGDWNEKTYRRMLAESSQGDAVPGWIPRGPLEFIFSDHSRAGIVFDSSWGEGLGKVGISREPYLGRPCPAGEITVMPRLATGDLEVRIAGEVATLERLLADELMKEFCPNVFLVRPFGKVDGLVKGSALSNGNGLALEVKP